MLAEWLLTFHVGQQDSSLAASAGPTRLRFGLLFPLRQIGNLFFGLTLPLTRVCFQAEEASQATGNGIAGGTSPSGV
jgi:hypothetical protein